MSSKFSSYLLLYCSFFFYSFSSIFLKLSAGYEILSVPFILCYGVVFFILGVYAILWQQILKKIPLSVAMANKPVVLILCMIWSAIFFSEEITLKLIIGMILIFAGIIIIGTEKGENE